MVARGRVEEGMSARGADLHGGGYSAGFDGDEQHHGAVNAGGARCGGICRRGKASAAGGGRFPSPSYPSAARSARIDGTVVLLVTVESSGVPSSVEIRTSSGHTLLDTAARDHLRRNWRWPSGESRLFIVPIKFVLQ